MQKTIVALAGLPASGKSAIAARLHKTLDSVLLDKDCVRASLFQQYVDYSNAQNDLCVEMIYEVANYLLSQDKAPVVIIDGRSFSRSSQIETLLKFVAKVQCRLIIIECICSSETARQRLEKDQGVHPAKDRDYALYSRSKAAAEPIEEARLILDTDQFSADECARQALNHIAEAQ